MLTDISGRTIRYLRVSVTDRCNLRCVYCMAENPVFMPRSELLSLEEMAEICRVFADHGIERIRLTGGEPLARRNVMALVNDLGNLVGEGRLRELTLTTNGTLLERFAAGLAAAGLRRVNVSLDTLDPTRFAHLTRGGDVATVIGGILAARRAGLAVRVNAVIAGPPDRNDLDRLVAWCGDLGLDLCLIEAMPMGRHDAAPVFPLAEVQRGLAERWTLLPSAHRSAGPARYVEVAETGQRIGFITPMSHGFCASCDRLRLTCAGMLHPCLGRNFGIDLRNPLRDDSSGAALREAIALAVAGKPDGHDFTQVRPSRSMSMTGG